MIDMILHVDVWRALEERRVLLQKATNDLAIEIANHNLDPSEKSVKRIELLAKLVSDIALNIAGFVAKE